jgi:glycerophosphoryl diester phosphodiesterase
MVDQIQYTFDSVGEGPQPRGCRVVEGDWSVRDGRLVADATSGAARIDFDSVTCENVAIEADVTFLEVASPTSWAAIRFGIEGDDALQHLATLRSGSAKSNGVEYTVWRPDGTWHVRVPGRTETPSPVGETRRLRVLTCGGRVRVSIDGQLAVESALGRDVRSGGVGLQAARGRVAFDNVSISPLSEDEIAAFHIEYGPLKRVRIIAHRGSSKSAPENTLVAVRRGVEEGAQGVEFDVYRTSDGEIVLMHDRDLSRTTNFRDVFPDAKSALVHEQSFDDLLKLDAGSWKDVEFQGERIPTLKDTLEYLHGRATPVIEIKPADIGRDVARLIRQTKMETDVFVQSFSARAIREFRAELPMVTTGYITGAVVSVDAVARAREHIRIAREAGANAIVCDHRLVVPEYIEELHARAMSLFVWTVDDVHTMECLARLGVDGIITNVPATLAEFLHSH